MSEVARLAMLADSTPLPTTTTTTTHRGSYLSKLLLSILTLSGAILGLMWNQQQLRGSSLTAYLRTSNASSSAPSFLSSSSSVSAPVSSRASSSLPTSLVPSSFHPACDYPLTQVDLSCPRFTNINLIGKRGIGDRFLQLAIVILVALDTNSVPILLDMHTVNGVHGNYTDLEGFLPFASSLPTLQEVEEKYPTLRRIKASHPGGYRDKITWLKAGGEPQEGGKEGGEAGCNLLMTIDMNVCGDFLKESCYFLGEPQYTRIRDIARCWMLRMKPEALPRLAWDSAEEDGREGRLQHQHQQQQQEYQQQKQCYNVAVHLRVGDSMLHQTDTLFFENLKKAVSVALEGFDCVHYHFFYEEDAMIKREKVEEEKRAVEMFEKEQKAKEQEEKDAKAAQSVQEEKQEEDKEKKNEEEEEEGVKEEVVLEKEKDAKAAQSVQEENQEEDKEKKNEEEEEEGVKEEAVLEKDKDEQDKEEAVVVEKEGEGADKRRLLDRGAPFPILNDIFREEIVTVEESVVVEEKKSGQEGREEEGLRKEGEEERGAEGSMGHANNTNQTRSTRKQRIRVSYHGRMDVRSTLYHFMNADMLVLTGSSFPYMAALLTPKPVILLGQPKEASRGGPKGEGTVGGAWFGGYGIGGRSGGIALLTDQGKVVSPETDTEWRAMVEMKYLDAAGRRVPYL